MMFYNLRSKKRIEMQKMESKRKLEDYNRMKEMRRKESYSSRVNLNQSAIVEKTNKIIDYVKKES